MPLRKACPVSAGNHALEVHALARFHRSRQILLHLVENVGTSIPPVGEGSFNTINILTPAILNYKFEGTGKL